jgi:hypothetical protein
MRQWIITNNIKFYHSKKLIIPIIIFIISTGSTNRNMLYRMNNYHACLLQIEEDTEEKKHYRLPIVRFTVYMYLLSDYSVAMSR